MNIDRTLAAEIRKLNGDGNREDKFKTLKKVKETRKMLSSPEVMRNFDKCIKACGRAPVALCVAATLLDREERLENYEIKWALDVISLWTNRGPSFLEEAVIVDDLHPTRICEYAGSFIEMTKE